MTTIAAASTNLAPPRPMRVGAQTDLLGECPLWDERLQCLWCSPSTSVASGAFTACPNRVCN